MSHIHNIVDTGKRFIINPASRAITTENDELILSQGDHNSERYTFELPRIVEGHDMNLCNRVEIHYDNISKSKKEVSEGTYIIDDMVTNGDAINFSWLISGNTTRLYGTVQFWINFVCIENDEIIYSWGTDVFKGVRVLANNRNTDTVVAKFPDVLELWKKEVVDEVVTGIPKEDILDAVNKYLDNHPVVGEPGEDGISPTISVEEIEKGYKISITDVNGTTEFELLNGTGGGVKFETDDTLVLEDGILKVNTTNDMEQDNTLPITSAGVFATVGNIEALLKTI